MHMCPKILHGMRMKGRQNLNLMLVRLLCMKILKRIEMISWKNGYEVDHDEQKSPDKKPGARGDNYTPIYQ